VVKEFQRKAASQVRTFHGEQLTSPNFKLLIWFGGWAYVNLPNFMSIGLAVVGDMTIFRFLS